MKRPILLSLIVLLGFASGWATASPKNGTQTMKRVIPVLLNINAKGQVTEVKPAYKVHPKFKQFLKDQLKKVVVDPAKENGRSVSIQYMLILALHAAQRGDGNYDVKLKLVSSKALPHGPWHWVHGTGHQLALASPSEPAFTPAGPSWTQKMRNLQATMGYHASDPLMR